MGNIIQWFKELDVWVIFRRGDKYKDNRLDPNHPENIPIDESSTIRNVEPEATAAICSPFYIACRTNDLEKAKRLLKTLTLRDIDCLEPNGSTALHAACFHGHQDMVKFLLEIGADRAVYNKYGCLPYDEAYNQEIKQLFIRIPNTNRLVSDTGAIEWERIDDDAVDEANNERLMIKSLYDRMNIPGTNQIRKMFEKIEQNYIEKSLAHTNGIEKIRRFFQRATEEEDPKWIITAFTAETDFYKVLNNELAGGCGKNNLERTYILALLLYHSKLDSLSYFGSSCRVMRVTGDIIEKYKEKPLFMTKTFMSSSIEEKISIWFAQRANQAQKQGTILTRHDFRGKLILQWVLCKYVIKKPRSALYIENISQYAMEGEVLIMPYTVFKVTNVSQVRASFLPDDCLIHMIDIEEYQ